MNQEMGSFVVDMLKVRIFKDRKALGRAAGEAVAEKMREILRYQKELFVVFAAAPSQNEFLEELGTRAGVDWGRVAAFHLDEYLGLPDTVPQSLGHFLRERLFKKVHPGSVLYLNGMAEDAEKECDRYAAFFKNHPFDIACIGIGENGHLAFNDPHVADFSDPVSIKMVELDLVSRRQQVNDRSFQNLESVPRKAITLTLPKIFSAKFIYCMVPAITKAQAVKKTLEGPITTDCPATILRKHENATLFLDGDSAKFIPDFRLKDPAG